MTLGAGNDILKIMDYLIEIFISALKMLLTLEPQILKIVFVSLWVSSISTLLAGMAGLPLGFYLGAYKYKGKQTVFVILHTFMAVPTVVIGLLVYSFICRQGPLGGMQLLYTPTAMIIGQFILALPIITALCFSAAENTDPRLKKTLFSLGANKFQTILAMIIETRLAVISAVMAGFSRVFAEIGISMMLGGNIDNYTRNITTTIALQTSKGEFALALALGMVLLSVALTMALGLNIFLQFARK